MQMLERAGKLVHATNSKSELETMLKVFDIGSAPSVPVHYEAPRHWADIQKRLQDTDEFSNGETLSECLDALLHRPYFSRARVVREVALAKRGVVSVDDLQEPKAQVARAAHTLSVCKRHLAHKLLSLRHSTLHHHN
jgi:hypothetical protein